MSRKPVFFILLVLLLGACTKGFPPEFPVPDFTLKSPMTGNEVSLQSIKGNPAIMYWYASW